MIMSSFDELLKPSKEEQKTAMESYTPFVTALNKLRSSNPEIEIEETGEKVKIPLTALKLLGEILDSLSKGIPVSIVPRATELTTQAAAEMLGCSRPHLVKLLEEGEIPYTKVGKHRRVRYEDLVNYKNEMKEKQKRLISDIMKGDEDLGLYDS